MTPSELARLRDRIDDEVLPCLVGYSETFLNAQCDAAIARSSSVKAVAANWPILEESYGYNEDESIRQCQARFCESQWSARWRSDAESRCCEWDDAAGCLAAACGNLSEIEARSGLDSVEYIEALVCRQSEVATTGERLPRGSTHCEREFDRCLIAERYLTPWRNQLARVGTVRTCWMSEANAVDGDALYQSEYAWLGTLPASTYFENVGPRFSFMQSACTLQRATCEATQGALVVSAGKVLAADEMRVPADGPFTPLEPRYGAFDGELYDELVAIGGAFGGPTGKPLARDMRLRRLESIPEATAGLAELIGISTFVRAGGATFAQGLLSPRVLDLFGSATPPPDTSAKPTDGFDAEIDAVGVVAEQLSTAEGMSVFARATELDEMVLYAHYRAILGARNGMELLDAYEDLVRDVDAMP